MNKLKVKNYNNNKIPSIKTQMDKKINKNSIKRNS